MNPLNRLRAEAAREVQARSQGAPTQPPVQSKKALAMQKADEEHRANVDSYFSNLVESVPIEARGSVRMNRDIPTFNEAAHNWGLLRLKADEQVRRDVLRNQSTASTSALPGAIPKLSPDQQRQIYKRGYVIWYLSGRPKPKLDPTHAEGYLTELAKHTATIDPPNPEGSGADRFKNSPVLLAQLNSYASQAYDHHLKTAPPPSRPTVVKRPLEAQAGLSDGERDVVVQRRFAPPETAPLPLALSGEVGQRFLKTPEAHHTFRASNLAAIRRNVAQYLSTDRVFQVSPMSEGNNGGMRAQEYQLAGGVQANGEMLYHALRDNHNINALFVGLRPGSDLRVAANWPEHFRALNLALVARGSYNSVWRLGRGPNGVNPAPPDALRALFPEDATEGLVRDTHVLRIPNADQWATYDEVMSEMLNVTEAALGRYGPTIAAMWVGRESKTVMPGTGHTQGRFKLFAILERGTDVNARITSMFQEQRHDIWTRYFQSLRRCVWRYSANRCLHLDGKLANLIDSFPSTGVSLATEGSTIKAIDLASDFYRRIQRLTPEESSSGTTATSPEMAQGWKLVWLYNILFVTCSLRLVLPVDVYHKVWWPPILKAVQSILRECVSERSHASRDAEYLRARAFLVQCKWKGGFLMSAVPKKPPDGDDPNALAETAFGMVRHYFHDQWYKEAVKRLVEPARAVRLADRSNAPASDRQALRQQRNQSWQWYNTVFRPRALPMIRFFSEKMAYADDERALPMIQVMYDYANASEEDLYPLTAGSRHPLRPTQIVTWPVARPTFDEQWLESVAWEDKRLAAREIGFGATQADFRVAL